MGNRVSLTCMIALLPALVIGQVAAFTDTIPAVKADSIHQQERIIHFRNEAAESMRLRLYWDEWGHSDLPVSLLNPFVPADISLGAAYLDASLGRPVASAIIPALSEYNPPGSESNWEPLLNSGNGASISYRLQPLHDPLRANQTLFSWDQGDYQFGNVQVGIAVQLDEKRNIMAGGETLSHPGQYGLAGPGFSQVDGSTLQNYVLDYRHHQSDQQAWNYTIIHQREQVGLPVVGTAFTTDDRRNRGWFQGLRYRWAGAAGYAQFRLASSVEDLRINQRIGDQRYLDRRSISQLLQSAGGWNFAQTYALDLSVQLRRRFINDRDWGATVNHLSEVRAGIQRSGPLSWYGGLAAVSNKLAPEVRIDLSTGPLKVSASSEKISSFALPSWNRRAAPDSVQWLSNPIVFRRTMIRVRSIQERVQLAAQAALFDTQDQRRAITFGADFDWIVIRKLARITAFAAVLATGATDSLYLPPRINSGANLELMVSHPSWRVKPFGSVGVLLTANDFSNWYDPRYANLAPLPQAGDPTSMTGWLVLDGGIRVRDFELKIRSWNLTNQTIQSAPPVPAGDGGGTFYYISPASLTHFTLTWRFRPAGGSK